MKTYAIVLAIAVFLASVSAFAGRDGSQLMLQEQQLKRVQQERAKVNDPAQDRQQMMENCKKMMSPKQS